MSQKKLVFVAGPYVGELGWELFSWQPMVRRCFLRARPDESIVFTGRGRSLFYPWVDKVLTVEGLPNIPSECLAWHNLQNHYSELQQAIQFVKQYVELNYPQEQWDTYVLNYDSIGGNLNDAHYQKGEPDLLKGDPKLAEQLVGENDGLIALCVRDREMSDWRNWPYKHWTELGRRLVASGETPVYLGQIQDPDSWVTPEGAINLLNQTDLNKALSVLSCRCRLAVGGSTGLMHLASRASVDHLVWGVEKNIPRYAETNWFGARHRVLPCGWHPPVDYIWTETKEALRWAAK
jgi:hypothetical protein